MSTLCVFRLARPIRVLLMVALLLSLTPTALAHAGPRNGVDDLRGRWEFVASDLAPEPLPFDIFIVDLELDPDSQAGNDYLAVGCMGSPGVDTLTPLALRATDLGGGVYELNLLSTAVPPPDMGEPYVIQFLGTVTAYGQGVPDDVAEGQVRTEFLEGGAWAGTHHDRRRPHCPPIDEIPPPGLDFHGDVYSRRQYEGDFLTEPSTILEGHTNIVSSGMRVERPDGSVVDVPFYTDIFSPDVDFISEFRYLEGYAGDPLSGGVYTFTLLDALGDPIAGTSRTDVWMGCLTDVPRNYVADVTPGLDIDLSWDAVSSVPGFDPANGIGFYQIGVWPWGFEADTYYGANGIANSTHVIPWASFGGDAPGSPDGYDYGDALSELDDGDYQVSVEAFSLPAPGNPGSGLECAVWDHAAWLYFAKTATSIDLLAP